jgi:hypothetical protein
MGSKTKQLSKAAEVPDDVFEGPGFTMKRYGRFIEMKTHRSPEEQAALRKRLWDSRSQTYAQIEKTTDDLLSLIRKYSSLDLVAHIWLRHGLFNPEEYKETESKNRPHFVEHATMLQLMQDVPTLTDELVVEEADLKRAETLLADIFELTTAYYLAESANPELGAAPSTLDELRYRTLLREMTVGPPSYTHHWIVILKALFSPEHIGAYLVETLGFNLEETLACIEVISAFMDGALRERIQVAKASQQTMRQELKSYMETGKFVGNLENKELFDRIRNLRAKERKRFISSAAYQWVTVALADVLSLPVGDLATRAGLSTETVTKFLDVFALGFGSTPSDYRIPSPIPPLRARPIVKTDSTYICLLPFNLLWAIKPRFEEALKASGRWNSYQKHRGSILIEKGLEALKSLLPSSQVHRNLSYPIGPNEEGELDGLVLFDRYAFLVEGKAGEFGAARRGGKERMKKGLSELVGEPIRQAARAREYILKAKSPKFTAPNGQDITVGARFTEISVITLTLDSLDVFTSEPHLLRRTGVLGPHDLPWAVCLTDLMAISEILRLPVEFTHFLRWRMSVDPGKNVSVGSDELNWLAVYLKEGPALLRVPSAFTELSFTSYTDKFDAYFMFTGGFRQKPAERPSQLIPTELRALLEGLEAAGTAGFTAPAEALLDLPFSERQRLSQQLAETRRRNEGTEFETEKLRVRAWYGKGALTELQTQLNGPSEGGKSTLLIAADSSETSYVDRWAWLAQTALSTDSAN